MYKKLILIIITAITPFSLKNGTLNSKKNIYLFL